MNLILKRTQNLKSLLADENLALVLIFLFPVAICYVRHWASYMFGLLFFFAVYYWIKYKTPKLVKQEKIFISFFLLYFAVFIITSLFNGWTEEQTVWLGLELRFLIIIPIYFMVRQLPTAADALLYGCIVSLVGGFIWGMYELYILKNPAGIYGIYGPLLFGPVTLLMMALIMPKYLVGKESDYKPWLALVCLLLGLFVVFNTTARSAYLAFFIIFSLFILINLRGKVLVGVVCAFLAVLYFIFSLTTLPAGRVKTAYKEARDYLNAENTARSSVAATSVGTRLEMLKALKLVIQDDPVFGVGRGNYNPTMKKYITQGKLNSSVAQHNHPHNVFAETLISRGLLGLTALLLLLYYPVWFYIKTYKAQSVTALTGMTHIIAITVFSLTDASTFIKGNYVAVNLVFMSIFFVWHLRKIGLIKQQ